MSLRFVLAALLVAGLIGLVRWSGGPSRSDSGSRLSVTEVLGQGDLSGYARATGPIEFEFPADHGAHPDFQTEWWYVTTNLFAEDGSRFGAQWTLFRNALAPASDEVEGGSAWSTRQAYMAHFAFSDVDGRRFRAFERFARGAQGLSGAELDPFRVWLEDWELASTGGPTFPMRLRAEEDGVSIDLTLEPAKPKVFQGEDGYSRKSAGAGNASYYYSFTRLEASGTVSIDGQTERVNGSAWLDREWSTSVLGTDQVGWDWFALQLEDGRDLMYYQLRKADGSADDFSEGVLVESDGSALHFDASAVTLTPTEWWTSDRSGARYPVVWALQVPDADLRLSVRAALRDQELDLTFRYWEGAVDVEGEDASGPVRGVGYLEMTGYEDASGGRTDVSRPTQRSP